MAQKRVGQEMASYNCSEPTHDLPCTRPTKCPNCDQPHSADYNECFYFTLDQEILTTQIEEKISYADAKKNVNNRFVKPDLSYSAAVSNQKQAYAGNTQNHPSPMTTSLRGAPARRARGAMLPRGLRRGGAISTHALARAVENLVVTEESLVMSKREEPLETDNMEIQDQAVITSGRHEHDGHGQAVHKCKH